MIWFFITSSGFTSLLIIKCLFEQLKTVYIYNNSSIFCELSMGFNTNTFEIWISFYRTSVSFPSQVEFFFRESRIQIAIENLPIDRHWGIDSCDCSVCLERLKKRKVTLKQCEATVWSGSEFAEHCFVFSNLSFFLVFPVYRTRSLHQSLNVCLLE